jgi:hypothetical protein
MRFSAIEEVMGVAVRRWCRLNHRRSQRGLWSHEEDEDNRRWKTIGVACSPCAIGVLPLKNKIVRTLKKLNSAEYASEG